MKRFLILPIAVLTAVIAMGTPALAQTERILNYHSRITIDSDSSLEVVETIRVVASGIDVKRGIFRDLPTRYQEEDGRNYTVELDVLEVQRDGVPEYHHMENRSNGIRVYIGKSNILLNPGTYTYTIRYRTLGHIGYFEDFDELYWNVTGNGWKFPIDSAGATIVLPMGADGQEISTSGYTGPQGSREQAYQMNKNSDGSLEFQSTRPLRPYEGLTVAVSFPKGFVRQIPREYFTSPAQMPLPPPKNGLLAVAVLAVLAYYLFAWRRVGRDPAKGVIIPLYYPPKDFPPDATRYLSRMGYDDKTFTTLILNLAVKGVVTIEEDSTKIGPFNLGKTYTLVRQGASQNSLNQTERDVFHELLPPSKDRLELDNKYHVHIRQAILGHRERLEKAIDKTYLYTNTGYFALGFAGSVALIFVTMLKGDHFRLLYLILAWIVIVLLNWLFYKLLKAPSTKGRRILDQVEGFKMFLAATEKEALKWLDVPEKTPYLYETFLPYAIALDVEEKWSEKFTEVLAAAAAAGYAPTWYYSGGHFDARAFGKNLDRGFSSAISSSSKAPGSGSGSGGGGSSGGGGGGGGGGGW